MDTNSMLICYYHIYLFQSIFKRLNKVHQHLTKHFELGPYAPPQKPNYIDFWIKIHSARKESPRDKS